MKNSNIFVGLGTLVLTISAFITSKEDKKLGLIGARFDIPDPINANNYIFAGFLPTVTGRSSNFFTVNQISGYVTVKIKTVNNTSITLKTSNGNDNLYFVP